MMRNPFERLLSRTKKNKGLPNFKSTPPPPPRKTPEEKLQQRAKRLGHQRFEIDGKVVYALNEHNARRKLNSQP